MILAHYKGLLTVCDVRKREGERVFVKVRDEKRPKWVDLSLGKQKLFGQHRRGLHMARGAFE